LPWANLSKFYYFNSEINSQITQNYNVKICSANYKVQKCAIQYREYIKSIIYDIIYKFPAIKYNVC